MYILLLSIVFFFFKRKTAYEMRISDWSSDVCSSDLHGYGTAGRPGRHPCRDFPAPGPVLPGLAALVLAALSYALSGHVATAPPRWQIGRASGRERVCQYV